LVSDIEEHRLRVFEDRALRRDEVMAGRIKLHNEELGGLCSSPRTIRIIKSSNMSREGHVARIWKKRNVYRLLERKPEEKSC
jgi:hypothetical protein